MRYDRINLYSSHDGETYSVRAAKWIVEHYNKKANKNKNHNNSYKKSKYTKNIYTELTV